MPAHSVSSHGMRVYRPEAHTTRRSPNVRLIPKSCIPDIHTTRRLLQTCLLSSISLTPLLCLSLYILYFFSTISSAAKSWKIRLTVINGDEFFFLFYYLKKIFFLAISKKRVNLSKKKKTSTSFTSLYR